MLKSYDARRETATARGYTHRWQKNSKARLKRYPLCAICLSQERVTEATVTDHIVPHKGDKEKFWDRDNHQSLCKACHDTKTATEDGGYGR